MAFQADARLLWLHKSQRQCTINIIPSKQRATIRPKSSAAFGSTCTSHTRSSMNKTLVAAVFAALIAGIAAAPDLHASSSSPSKKLLQWQWNRNTNLAANTARASIATSDAINRAVDNGASLRATRGAGVVGSNMAWAASQDQDVFNTVERFFDAGRKLRTMAEGRQLLQYGWNRNVNLAANTARASIATSDAINRAVDNGASLRSTRGAGIVGSNMAWAAAQGNQDVFNTVQRFYDAGRKLRMMPEGRQA